MQRRIVAVVAALALAATACAQGSSATQSITDADNLTRIDLPSDWQHFSSDELSGLATTPFVVQSAGFEMPVVARFAFDASPVPTTDHFLLPLSDADFPIGSSVVRRISPLTRDFVSRFILAEAVAPYHQASESRLLAKKDIDLGNDYRGVQVTVTYNDPGTEAEVGVHLISLTNPEVTMLYHVAIGCSLECFDAFGLQILEIVDTWLVNTRG